MNTKRKSAFLTTHNIVVAFFSLFYLANMLLGFRLNDYFALSPKALFENYQVWRLFTFPLCSIETESILLFVFMYGIVAVRINKYFSNIISVHFILPLLFACEGLLFAYTYHLTPETNLVGADAASFAILTVLISLYRKRRTFQELNRLRKLVTFSLLYLALWISIFAYKTEVLDIAYNVESVVSGLVCGMCAALICILRFNTELRYRLYYYIKTKELEVKTKEQQEAAAANGTNGSDLKDSDLFSAGQQMMNQMFEQHDEEETADLEDIYKKQAAQNTEDKEEILNRLLDKINANGKDALTDDEKKFLTEYSKYIK